MKWFSTWSILLAAACMAIGGSVLLAAQGDGAAGAAPALKMLKTIPVEGTGRWDYLYPDSDGRRLYLPRSNHTQVIDMDSGKVVGDIPGTTGVHGVAIAPDQGLGFASSSPVTVFDLKTLKVTKTINAGNGPDAITYDPASKHIMVICHRGGTIGVIDPAALDKEPVTINVGGTLEYAQPDGNGHVFVNMEDKSEVVEVDSKENRVLAHWSLAPGEGPSGLAIDTKNHRLFAGCANSKCIVIDYESGKQLAALDVGAGIDGAAFEPTLGVAMTANGRDGTISVIKETAPGKFAVIQTVKTINGARTINVDTKLHQAYLPCNISQGNFGLAVVGAEK